MSNRDKFLTEAMDECWHEEVREEDHQCADVKISVCKCGITAIKGYHDIMSSGFKQTNNFSTWAGFGKLFTWSQKQDWWENFRAFNHYRDDFDNYLESRYDMPESLIDPDRFADAVYFMST